MTLTLTPTISYSNVEWQDGSGDAMYTVRCPGIYWVEVINVCGSQRDSVTINFQPEPVIDLGNDTALCIGDTVILSPTFSGGAISWQDGSTDSLFPVTSIGSYWAEVTDFCGSIHDSVTIDSLPFPSLSIGEDTTICWNSSILLNVTTNAASIQWLDLSLIHI